MFFYRTKITVKETTVCEERRLFSFTNKSERNDIIKFTVIFANQTLFNIITLVSLPCSKKSVLQLGFQSFGMIRLTLVS